MKSTEVYQQIKIVFASWCKANEFKRTQGGMLGWYKPYGDRFVTFWFQCSQDGWNEFAGSKFTVEFQVGSDPRPGTPAVVCQRLGFLLDPDQLESLKHVQNEVISKLKKPGSDYFMLQMEQRVRDWYLSKFDLLPVAPLSKGDHWLRYHDPGDIQRWAAFVLSALPGVFKQVAPDLVLVST